MDAPDDVVDELYGVPFDEFIARRDARAKELRRDKRREEADAVKALRKPALSAWAIDQLVRSHSDEVDGLLAAGAALRQAKGGDTLRDASHEEREAVELLAERAAVVLRDAGKPVTDKTAAELRDTLHAAALDDEVRALLERGRLVEAHQAIGLGGFGLGVPGEPELEPAREPAKTREPKAKAKRQQKQEQESKPAPKPKPSAAARKAVRAAEAVLRDRERDLRAARREVGDRERDLKRAERALAKAEEDADAAAEAVEEAEAELERRRSELDG